MILNILIFFINGEPTTGCNKNVPVTPLFILNSKHYSIQLIDKNR